MDKTLILGDKDSIKLSLTTTQGDEAKRPHQAFVTITESTGLEVSLPLDIKSSGKASVTIVRDRRILHKRPN